MKRKTAALALIAPLAATVLLAQPAFADGTVHFDESVPCFTDFSGNEVCSTNVGQYNLTTTPSQMYIYVLQGSTSYTITTPDGTRYSGLRHVQGSVRDRPGGEREPRDEVGDVPDVRYR